jgi:hypothetical protein
MNKYLSQRLRKKGVWKRILRERLAEPLHLNLVYYAINGVLYLS